MYDPWGRRIWKQDYNSYNGDDDVRSVFLWRDGAKAGELQLRVADGGFGSTLQGINTYFGGKLLSEKGVYVTTDRLGVCGRIAME